MSRVTESRKILNDDVYVRSKGKCPYRILKDLTFTLSIGVIGGAIYHSYKLTRPRYYRRIQFWRPDIVLEGGRRLTYFHRWRSWRKYRNSFFKPARTITAWGTGFAFFDCVFEHMIGPLVGPLLAGSTVGMIGGYGKGAPMKMALNGLKIILVLEILLTVFTIHQTEESKRPNLRKPMGPLDNFIEE